MARTSQGWKNVKIKGPIPSGTDSVGTEVIAIVGTLEPFATWGSREETEMQGVHGASSTSATRLSSQVEARQSYLPGLAFRQKLGC